MASTGGAEAQGDGVALQSTDLTVSAASSGEASVPATSIEDLPVDVLASSLLSWLDGVDVVRCGLTCRHFHQAARDQHLWRMQYYKAFVDAPLLRLIEIAVADAVDECRGGVDWEVARTRDEMNDHRKRAKKRFSGVHAVQDWRHAYALAHQITRNADSVRLLPTGVRIAPRAGASAVRLPGRNTVAVIGGATTGYCMRHDLDLLRLDTGTVQSVKAVGTRRGSVLAKWGDGRVVPGWLQTATVVDGTVYLFGGQDVGEATSNLWALTEPDKDTPSFELLGPVVSGARDSLRSEVTAPVWPCERAGHTTVAHPEESHLVCFGGLGPGKATLSDLWQFDTAGAGGWTQLPSGVEAGGPSPRWCHAAAVLPKRRLMYVFGGWDYPSSIFLNDMYAFNFDANSWTRVNPHGDIPEPRSQCMLVPVGSERFLLLYGGANHETQPQSRAYGDAVRDLDDLHLFDVETQTWFRCACGGYPELRGGVNSHVQIPLPDVLGSGHTILVLGGMHSDAGVNMPHFKGETAAVNVRLKSPNGPAAMISIGHSEFAI